MGIGYLGTHWYGLPQISETWKLKFAWLPKRCELSGRKIWLESAYECTRKITGVNNPLSIKWWHDKHEHLIWLLKKD